MRAKHYLNAVGTLLLCASCGQYDVSINERVVYTPPPLVDPEAIPDQALRQCIQTNAKEKGIRSRRALRHLRCPNQGITDITGLALYQNLTLIDLSSNEIVDASELSELEQLGNLNLDGNMQLNCESVSEAYSTTILPSHCRQ